MDQDRDIRLRLTAVADIGDAKQRLLELLDIQNQLIATNERQRAASRQKALDSVAEGSREKGLIESLIAKQKELAEAKKQATTLKELRHYNEELARTELKLRQIEGATNAHTAAVHRQAGGFRNLRTVIGAALSTAAVLQFGKGMLDAGSNAESFGLTLQTLLGSKTKADQVAAQAVDLAKKTPFTLRQIQEQIVGLSAYNIEAGKLIPTITTLGNISAAVGTEKLPQLTLAYGQVRAANKLTGNELRQFTEAGVDLLGLLATQGKKSMNEVREDTAKSKVSFADVEKALASTSAAGGKFYNLMQSRSGVVGGLISNFSDVVYQGYVRIEKQYDQTTKGVIRWGIETVDALLGSESATRRTIEAVKVLFAAWVTYRAIMIANTVQTRLASAETLGYVGVQRLLFVATNDTNLATKGLFATLKANPIGLITAGVGLLITAYQTWKTSQVEVISALGEEEIKLRGERRELVATVAEAKRHAVGTKERAAQIAILQQKYPDFLKNLDAEKFSNAELNKRLYEVNLQYKDRIKLASLAYAVEQNQGAQNDLTKRNFDAVERMKKEFPQVKFQATELAEAIREVERAGVKTVTNMVLGTDGLTKSLDALDYYRQQAIEISKGQVALDREINDLTAKKTALTDKLTDKTASANETAATKEKKWHNDALTRALNRARMMEAGLEREWAINKAEEEIAADKAKHDGYTEAEIYGVRLEFHEKRKKLIEDEKKDAQKRLGDIEEAVRKTKDSLQDVATKEADALKKLADENSELLFKQARERATSAAEEIRIINDRIFRLNLWLTNRRAAGKLEAKEAAETNNEILKLQTEREKVQADGIHTEAQRIQRAEEEKRKQFRETSQVVVQALQSFESQSIRSLSLIVTAFQQLTDARNDLKDAIANGQGVDEARQREQVAKIGFGLQAAGALSQAFFLAQSEQNARLLRQAEGRYEAEKKAVADRHAAELAAFQGTETEKQNLSRRQKAEEARLEEEFRKKKAALQLKQWRAEQAAKIAQTLMAGALATVQSIGQYGPAGPFIIAALTAAQVATIASQKAPQFYNQGTEYVDKDRRHPAGVDTVPTMLTRGERVISAQDNRKLRGISNQQLVQRFQMPELERLPAHRYILEGLPLTKSASSMKGTERLLREVSGKLNDLKKLDGLRPRSNRRGYNPDAATRHRGLFGN